MTTQPPMQPYMGAPIRRREDVRLDVPDVETVIMEEAPSPLNPLGVKGAGEGAILATGAALGNAVAHALSPFGIRVNSLPLSPGNTRRWLGEADGHP